jgi:F-type H+-transporting ATPase subunit b
VAIVEKLVELLGDAEFWVAVAFVIFVIGMGYLGVHKMKDEAAQLLAEYQRKRQQAETEAQDIVTGAKAEAERMAIEAKAKIDEFVARRTKMAETKIAQAEAQAAADVRAAAADAAVTAAEQILRQETKGPLAADLIAKGIEDVRKKLN